jgi:hypothetical protein
MRANGRQEAMTIVSILWKRSALHGLSLSAGPLGETFAVDALISGLNYHAEGSVA